MWQFVFVLMYATVIVSAVAVGYHASVFIKRVSNRSYYVFGSWFTVYTIALAAVVYMLSTR